MTKVNFLADCYHPASYLLLKNVVARLVSEGHAVLWCIREKDVLADLMHESGDRFEILTIPKPGIVGRLSELLEHDLKILRRLWKHKIDVALGGHSFSVAHAVLFSKARSVVFTDHDQKAVPEF